ncbi:hypothetical protein GCM10009560_56860 [Nonomuraea longicatena]|uniref:Uncharacterized protein n=1 Tax=Nonomuraea longicatena TaxID=83682 RepID=A0ABN1QJ69_9ACTN
MRVAHEPMRARTHRAVIGPVRAAGHRIHGGITKPVDSMELVKTAVLAEGQARELSA